MIKNMLKRDCQSKYERFLRSIKGQNRLKSKTAWTIFRPLWRKPFQGKLFYDKSQKTAKKHGPFFHTELDPLATFWRILKKFYRLRFPAYWKQAQKARIFDILTLKCRVFDDLHFFHWKINMIFEFLAPNYLDKDI